MKALFRNSYPTKSEKLGEYEMWVFEVQGTSTEVEQFKADQGERLRTDDVTGAPLFFTAYPVMGCDRTAMELYRSSKGSYSLDNSAMRRAESIARTMKAETQFKTLAMQELTSTVFSKRRVSIATVEDVAKVEGVAEEADLDNI